MDRAIIVALVLLLSSSCYDFNWDESSGGEDVLSSSLEVNTTLEALHTLYDMGIRSIGEQLVVEGVVTANDEYGNFFKTFVIESEGYAIEVLDGLYDSYVRHPVGATVALSLEGLTMDKYREVLRAGLSSESTSYYTLDYMGAEAVVDLYVEVTGLDTPITPSLTTIDRLDSDQAGRLVRLESLLYHSDDGVQSSWEGYILFRDQQLDSIWCYTSSYADFANNMVPLTAVSISGIVQYGATDELSDQYIIQMRGEDDCVE